MGRVQAFEERLVYDVKERVGYAKVDEGTSNTVPLMLKERVGIVLLKDIPSQVRARIIYKGSLKALVSSQVEIGKLQIIAEKNILIEKPVFTAGTSEETDWVGKTKDAIYEITIGWIENCYHLVFVIDKG